MLNIDEFLGMHLELVHPESNDSGLRDVPQVYCL